MLAQAPAIAVAPPRTLRVPAVRLDVLQVLAKLIERTGRDEARRAQRDGDLAYWTSVARGL